VWGEVKLEELFEIANYGRDPRNGPANSIMDSRNKYNVYLNGSGVGLTTRAKSDII
jgi:hypothetical protein